MLAVLLLAAALARGARPPYPHEIESCLGRDMPVAVSMEFEE